MTDATDLTPAGPKGRNHLAPQDGSGISAIRPGRNRRCKRNAIDDESNCREMGGFGEDHAGIPVVKAGA
jgi:hypothetical protein